MHGVVKAEGTDAELYMSPEEILAQVCNQFRILCPLVLEQNLSIDGTAILSL